MKVFITGATGFVGGHVVDELLRSDARIVALARTPTRAIALQDKGVATVIGSLSDSAVLTEALAGVDAVYHVAGLTAARNEAHFRSVNRDGTAQLVRAAVDSGVRRFVLISSLAAAGPSKSGTRRMTALPTEPVTAYGRSKAAAEAVLLDSPLDWTILRPPAVYGPGDQELLRVFKASKLGVAPVFGDGSQELSMVFGPDLARAILAAGGTERTIGGVYYPAHPEIVTTRELVAAIGKAMGRQVKIFGLPRVVAAMILAATETTAKLTGRPTLLSVDKINEFFQPAWTCDPSRLMSDTGWRPETSFQLGISITRDWYRRRGWL